MREKGAAPTLVIGDHVFVSKLAYGPLLPGTSARLYSRLPPRRADVMVFKFPENMEQDFVKRAIALPGDRLEVINGRPILNGWLVPHCHVGKLQIESRQSELYVEFLEERSYLTLYDNNPDEESCAGGKADLAGRARRRGALREHQGARHVGLDELWPRRRDRPRSALR